MEKFRKITIKDPGKSIGVVNYGTVRTPITLSLSYDQIHNIVCLYCGPKYIFAISPFDDKTEVQIDEKNYNLSDEELFGVKKGVSNVEKSPVRAFKVGTPIDDTKVNETLIVNSNEDNLSEAIKEEVVTTADTKEDDYTIDSISENETIDNTTDDPVANVESSETETVAAKPVYNNNHKNGKKFHKN